MKLSVKKVFFFPFLGLLISILSFANTKGQSASQKKPNKLQHSLPDEMRKKEEWKTRGVIIKFHLWPNAKQQKEIIRRLKASGLKKTKDIKSFKTQLFEWSDGSLKSYSSGEKTCQKLKNLSIVKRCNPDSLLPVNHLQSFSVISSRKKQAYRLKLKSIMFEKSQKSDEYLIKPSFLLADSTSDTEAKFIVNCASCRKQNLLPELPLDNNIRTCNILSCKEKSEGEKSSCKHLDGGRLSDYWAQELIGVDLLREELKNISPPKRENWISVFDTQKESHSTYVRNLISDEGPHAVLPKLEDEKTDLFEGKVEKYSRNVLSLFRTRFPGDYVTEANDLQKTSPHFINHSMSWGNSEDIYEVFQELSPPAIVVTASENIFFGRLSTLKNKASKNFDVINVGSLDSNGFVSDFSSSGEEVHIMAPSGGWLSSAKENGDPKQFSGTSGATPLVTGSLAGFEWLSGYHPTSKEAKILLEKTALPTLHSHEEPQVNGVGLVNSYKLGRVGKRLKEKCKNKSLFCFKEEILNEENYYFDLDKLDKNLKRDLGKVFPDCAGKKPSNSEASNCKEKGEVLKRLRQAILLNPKESKDFLKSLSCIYKEGGFLQNAKALDRLAVALGSREEVRTDVKALAEMKEPIPHQVIRLVLGMGGFEKEFNLFERKEAIRVAGAIGERGVILVEKVFNQSSDPALREMAIDAAGKMGESGLSLVKQALETNDPKLQKAAMYAVSWMGEPGIPLLEQAFETGDLNLQKEVVNVASLMGESGLPLLEQAFETGDLNLQTEVVNVAGLMGESGLPLLEQAFETGDLNLQTEVVNVAGLMEEPALLPILNRFLGNKNLDPRIRQAIRQIIKELSF